MGLVSGAPGSVLVGGLTSPGSGKITKIPPDGVVTDLFGASTAYDNPSGFAFDAPGRLFFTTFGNGRVYRCDGGTPVHIISLPQANALAVDALGRLVVNAYGETGLRLYTPDGALLSASFATVLSGTPMARAPGGLWGTNLVVVGTSGELLRLNADGTTVSLGSGFGDLLDLRFGPEGALYSSDFAGDRIWRIAPVMGIPTPAGLISWWRGEGNAADETGAHPGTPQGGLAYAPGQIGQAFALNGQNAAVALGNWFNLQQFTLSFWVNPAASQVHWADILDNNHTDFRSWVFQSGNNSAGATSRWSWGAAGVAGDYYWLSNSTWQHVVATMSADHVTELYVNGQSRFKRAGGGPVAYDGTQFMNLGKHHLLGRYFNGLVDELMCFSRPLSSEEVASLYFNQGGPLPLSIQSVSGGVLLSWPASAASFGLVSRTNLAAGAWESVTNAPSLNGDRKEVLLPAITPVQRFFRLAQ